ncbi:MAG: hypothetical protein ACRENE_02610 [Polyangiaceae bacterium]
MARSLHGGPHAESAERVESGAGEGDGRGRRDRGDRAASTSQVDRPAETAGESSFVASHDILFAEATERRCDACNRLLDDDGEADDDGGYAVAGEGAYLWARGDEVRFERAPLCPSCAAAIGMAALARWEIEEEEG